jgi:hypothetical protein
VVQQQEEMMPSSGDDSERSAIEAAYQEQIHALFKVLVNNLIDEPISHQTDQQSLAKFTAGLNVAKRARQLALSAVAPRLAAATRGLRRRKNPAK